MYIYIYTHWQCSYCGKHSPGKIKPRIKNVWPIWERQRIISSRLDHLPVGGLPISQEWLHRTPHWSSNPLCAFPSPQPQHALHPIQQIVLFICCHSYHWLPRHDVALCTSRQSGRRACQPAGTSLQVALASRQWRPAIPSPGLAASDAGVTTCSVVSLVPRMGGRWFQRGNKPVERGPSVREIGCSVPGRVKPMTYSIDICRFLARRLVLLG